MSFNQLASLPFAFLGAHAFAVKFQDHSVVHQPVNGRHSGHWIFEDLIPFREDQVTADHYATPFIALGQESKQHLPFLLDPAERNQGRRGRRRHGHRVS